MASASGVAEKAGGFAIKKALKILATKLKHGDVTDEKTRQMIMDELQKVRESLDVLRQKEFNTAKQQIKIAFRLFQEGKDATEEFKMARANATLSVNAVQNVSDKVEAIKMAAVCAVYECGDGMDRAKTFCLGYVDQLLSLPEVESYFDVKYSKGIAGKFKGLFNRSDRDDVIDQVFSCNRSLNSYMCGTGVDWQVRTTKKGVVIHPLTVTMENGRISEGDTCKCDTSGDDGSQELTSDLPQSTCVKKRLLLDRSHKIHRFGVTGDRGYRIRIKAFDERPIDGTDSIQVTSPWRVKTSMDTSDGMKYGGIYTAAIRNNLIMLNTVDDLYLYDISSGKRLWKATCPYSLAVELQWRCDKHAKIVTNGETLRTINMW